MKPKVITWIDSNIFPEQQSIDGEFETAKIISVGFLVKEDDDCIVIASDLIGKDIRRVLIIPKINVLSVK